MHLRDQSKAPKNAKLHSHISVTLSLLEPREIYQNEWSEPIFQNEHQIYDPEDLRRPSSLPMFLHHFCLAEKLRTLGESLPEMPPTFILALSSVCTIHHHVLHWGMKRFLLLIPAILSFHSPGFCHVFVLISSQPRRGSRCFQFSGSSWSLKCVCSCGFDSGVLTCRFPRSRNLCQNLRFWLCFLRIYTKKIWTVRLTQAGFEWDRWNGGGAYWLLNRETRGR